MAQSTPTSWSQRDCTTPACEWSNATLCYLSVVPQTANSGVPHRTADAPLACNRGYWEPAKFVAKLRHMKTDRTLLLVSAQPLCSRECMHIPGVLIAPPAVGTCQAASHFPMQFKCEMGAGHFRCGILHAVQAVQTVCRSQSACHYRGDVCHAVNPGGSTA